MSRRLFSFVIGVALGASAMPAFAITCYEIIDRNDVVVLRDTNSPVDLSSAGAPAREAMRSRGELLVIYDVERCVVIGRASATGSRKLTTDEIVTGWKSFAGTSGFGGTYGGTIAPDSGGGISAPAPTNVGRTPAAQGAAGARGARY